MKLEFSETVSQNDIQKIMSKINKPQTQKFTFLNKKDCMTNYYFFRNSLSSEEITNISTIAQQFPIETGNVSGTVDATYRQSDITWIPRCDDTEHIYRRIINLAMTANSDMWNFTLTGLEDDLQYTIYYGEKEGFYDWHYDLGGTQSSTRKLSIVVQLSDEEEYEGGELQFMMNRSIVTAPKGKGTVICFPSYILHRVTPVSKGIRKSLVIWIHGPTFS